MGFINEFREVLYNYIYEIQGTVDVLQIIFWSILWLIN